MSLNERATDIARLTAQFSQLLKDAALPEPRFDADHNQDFLDSGSRDFQNVRLSLMQQCQDLLELVTGPIMRLKLEVPTSIQFNSALAVAVHWNFAQHVPLEPCHSISFEDLGARVDLHTDRVTRVLRCVVAHRVFEESPPGHVKHTAASRVLLDHGARAWLGHQFEEMLPASAKLVDSFHMYPDVHSDRETAFSVAFAGDQPSTYWEVLEKTPWKVSRFADALEYATSSGGPEDFRPLIACYDWKKFGVSTLVDVGGSSGRVSAAIAEHADPGMKFIIQDLPELEPAATTAITKSCLENRAKFVSHDFFQPQPILDAKVYLYRQILHDWPDKMAIDILRAAVPALTAGDYILLVETIQPPPGVLPNGAERLIRAADLLMMAKHNSKERTIEMWKALIAEADSRFLFEGFKSCESHEESGAIIEIRWNP